MKLPEITPLDAPTDGSQSNATAVLPQAEAGFFNSVNVSAAAAPTTKRSLRWLWVSLGIVLGLLLAAYIGLSLFFMNHFTFNTTVNGIDVSFQSAEAVDMLLASEMGNYTLQVEGRENQKGIIHGSDIDLHYVADGQIDVILAGQMEWFWPAALFPGNASTIQHVSVEFNEQSLSTALQTLAITDKEKMREPVDAHLDFEGNAYTISPGDEGTTLDIAKTEQAIVSAIDAGMTLLNLDEEGLYTRPVITADDPSLAADRDYFNKYVPFQITYVFGDRREVLDANTTINWVSNPEGEGPYALDTAAIEAWLFDLASRYDTVGATRTIVNGFGEEKTVSGGTYGWEIDQEAELYAIMEAAAQRLGEEREPYLLGSAGSLDAQDWGKTYLEVDISHQYMWYYVDGVVVLETDVITGNPNTGYATPEGAYYVFSKATNIVTRGDPLPGGGYEWEVPVTYWMPFTYSGCGFHDAYWQPSFGGDYYLYRGSHGCINMPPHLAAELYDMVEVETPVIVHY